MGDIVEEAVKYLMKYGNTRRADLVKYLTDVKNFSKRTVDKELRESIQKHQFHRIVHSTISPSATYIGLKPPTKSWELYEVNYEDLHPSYALLVAELDGVLDSIDLADEETREQKDFQNMIKLAKIYRNIFYRKGKALGRLTRR